MEMEHSDTYVSGNLIDEAEISSAVLLDNIDPLNNLRFSIKTALNGMYFKPLLCSNEQISEEIRKNSSITAVCLSCPNNVSNKHKKIKVNILNNSNLLTHLRRHHSPEMADTFKNYLLRKREEIVVSNSSQVSETRLRKAATSLSLQSQFDKSIVDFIIQAMIPLKAVDDPTFRKLFDFFQIEKTGLKLMSRRSLGRRLDQNYLEHKEQNKMILKNVPWVCTTADIWSGRKRSFIGVTAHWIDTKNDRKSIALACKRFKGCHTHDRIAALLHEIHRSYELNPKKIVATVTDNASNFVKSFKVYGVKFQNINVEVENSSDTDELDVSDVDDEDLNDDNEDLNDDDDDDEEIEENWVSIDDVIRLPSHLRCAAHTLSLCASSDLSKAISGNSEMLKLHDTALDRCNILWRMSLRPKTAEIIEEIMGKSLVRPIITRWNSLFDSLKDILGTRKYGGLLKTRLNIQNCLTETDFLYIQEYVACAKPLAEAIDILQGERNAYYGILLPTILALRRKLQNLARQELQFCKEIAECFLNSVEKRFSEFINVNTSVGENAAIAALSFPKLKRKWFPCIEINDQEKLINIFKNIIKENLDEPIINEDGEVSIPVIEKDFFDFGEDIESSEITNQVDSIMIQYFNDKRTSCDMLQRHPVIEKIFRQYNTPLPSSAQVERLFSYATMANMPKSNKLNDEKFEKRVILKANFSIN